MTKLEQLPTEDLGLSVLTIEREAAIKANKEDNEAAYRQGVEDARTIHALEAAEIYRDEARRHLRNYNFDYRHYGKSNMHLFKGKLWEAFRGARGIARAEIRQRLARLETP